MARLKIDRAGRLVIPKPIREQLGLEAGAELEMEQSGDRIALIPVRATGPLTKEHGVWVWRTGERLTAAETNSVLEQVRMERGESARGRKR